MTDDLIRRADENYFDSWRTIVPNMRGGEIREASGVLIVASGLPLAWFNLLLITRPLADPKRQIRDAVTYFDAHKLPFVLRLRQQTDPAAERAAVDLGLPFSDTVPAMVLQDLAPARRRESPLEVRTARDAATLADHGAILAAAFGMPDDFVSALMTPAQGEVSNLELYVGYVAGRPVASSALLASRRVAGVYNVGCVPEMRRRGYGEAMTWHCLKRGLELGCDIASLQASDMGQPVYEGMGFRQVTGYRTFVRPERQT